MQAKDNAFGASDSWGKHFEAWNLSGEVNGMLMLNDHGKFWKADKKPARRFRRSVVLFSVSTFLWLYLFTPLRAEC